MPTPHNSKPYNIKEDNGRRKNSLQASHLMMMIENKSVEIWKRGRDLWVLTEKFSSLKANTLI